MAYAIATAVQFLLPSTKVFRPRDFAEALTYLNMTRAEISFAEQEIGRLGQTMSAPLVAPSFLLSPSKVG